MSFVVNPYFLAKYDSSHSGLFDGTNEELDLGVTLNAILEYNTAFSISCWVKRVGTGTNQAMCGNRSTSPNDGVAFMFHSTDTLQLQIVSSVSNVLQVRTNNTFASTSVWYHAVCTYDGSTNASGAKIYVDGSSEAVTATADTLSAAVTAAEDFKIGRAGVRSEFFNGYIDELSIWDKELSASEVTELYNSGCPDNLDNHSASANLQHWWAFLSSDDMTATTGSVEDRAGANDATPVNTEVGDLTTTIPC